MKRSRIKKAMPYIKKIERGLSTTGKRAVREKGTRKLPEDPSQILIDFPIQNLIHIYSTRIVNLRWDMIGRERGLHFPKREWSFLF
jgi:hypothetical protein